MRRALAGPVLLGLAIRLALILVSDRVVADVQRYERVGRHLLDVSWNPYETHHLYPYPPLWATAEAAAEWMARRGLGTFAVDIKLPVLLADVLIVWALVAAGRSARAPCVAAWLYAVHPVALLVTGAHGQFDAIALLFVMLGLTELARGRRDTSALWLSAAITTKSFPVLLLPFLAFSGGATRRQTARYILLALGPVAIVLLPFAIADPTALRTELLAYSGVADFGWTGLVRGLSWVTSGVLPRSEARFWPVASMTSKVLFLGAWAGLVVATLRTRLVWAPEKACLATLLTFHVFYGAQSAQYLLWVVPLGVLFPGRGLLAHALAATAGLVGFYLFLAPGVLLPHPLEGPAADWAGRLWVVGVGATLAVSSAWLAGLLHEGARAARARSRQARPTVTAQGREESR